MNIVKNKIVYGENIFALRINTYDEKNQIYRGLGLFCSVKKKKYFHFLTIVLILLAKKEVFES